MKVIYSYVPTICVFLTLIADGYSDEDAELSTVLTPSESAENSTLPSVSMPSAPGWWIGPVQPVNTFEAEESENDTLSIENKTSSEELKFTPLIIIRYPLEGPPEILFGSLIPENRTFVVENEVGNSTNEKDIVDLNIFNITDFPFFPVEEEIDEEIMFDTPNGTEVWIDDFFVIPDENITEEIENKTEEVESTVLPTGDNNQEVETTDLPTGDNNQEVETTDLPTGDNNQEVETTVLPAENTSDTDAEVSSLIEPQETTTILSPSTQDTKNPTEGEM